MKEMIMKYLPIAIGAIVGLIVLIVIIVVLVKVIKNLTRKEKPDKALDKIDSLEEHTFTILDYYKFDFETYYSKYRAELVLAKDDETEDKFLFAPDDIHPINWKDTEDNKTTNPLKKFKKKGSRFTNGEKFEYGKSGGRYKLIKKYKSVTIEKKKLVIPCPYYTEKSDNIKIIDAVIKGRKIKHYNKKIKVDEMMDATYYDIFYIIDRP